MAELEDAWDRFKAQSDDQRLVAYQYGPAIRTILRSLLDDVLHLHRPGAEGERPDAIRELRDRIEVLGTDG